MSLGLGSSLSTGIASGALENNRWGLDFDGTNDYLSGGDHPSLSFGADGTTGNEPSFSCSAWIYLDTAAHFPIIAKSETAAAGKNEYSFHTDGNGDLTFQLFDNDSSTHISTRFDTALSTGQWYHVGFAYDGSRATSGMKLFVDGDEKTKTDNSAGNTYSAMHGGTGSFTIGGRWTGGGSSIDEYADGKISDVIVWDVAQSEATMAVIYNAGNNFSPLVNQTNYLTGRANVKGWWKLGDNSDRLPIFFDYARGTQLGSEQLNYAGDHIGDFDVSSDVTRWSNSADGEGELALSHDADNGMLFAQGSGTVGWASKSFTAASGQTYVLEWETVAGASNDGIFNFRVTIVLNT